MRPTLGREASRLLIQHREEERGARGWGGCLGCKGREDAERRERKGEIERWPRFEVVVVGLMEVAGQGGVGLGLERRDREREESSGVRGRERESCVERERKPGS